MLYRHARAVLRRGCAPLDEKNALGSSTHQGHAASNPGRMKGTLTRTYGVRVPFMR
jgi:hypothetical protein